MGEATLSGRASGTMTRYDVAFHVPWIGYLLAGVGDAPPGGAETQIHLLARGLAARGLRVCVIAYDPGGLPRNFDGVDVIARPPPRWRTAPGVRGKLAEVATVLRTVASVDAGVFVHRGTTMDIAFVALATRARGRRLIYSSANTIDFTWGRVTSRRNALLYKLGIALAQTIVVQTPEQVRLCQRHFGRSPVMIKSIAEAAEARTQAPEAFLWVGKLVDYKRPLAYLDLARAVPEASFRMVGVPDEHGRTTLGREVERAAAEIPNLELLAPRPRAELVVLNDTAVAAVNTSDYEGMPNTLLEAWSRGVPALALAHDPDGVIAREQLGGFAAGSPQRLADLAREMWRTRGDQRALQQRCRAYVRREHGVDAVVDRWVDALGVNRAARGRGTGGRRTDVTYGTWDDAWKQFDRTLRELVARESVRRICEVGAGARPALPLDVAEAAGVEYTIVDESRNELDKAPEGYVKVEADVTRPDAAFGRGYDLVFSRLVIEHVGDPRAFHRNVHAALEPGGVAFHFFATLYSPPFVANRLLPERASRAILHRLQPHRRSDPRESKFPARYRWCRGPTRRQRARFEELGYRVDVYRGFFGTSRYYERMPPLRAVDDRLTALLLKHPVPLLTSFAHVLLVRHEQRTARSTSATKR